HELAAGRLDVGVGRRKRVAAGHVEAVDGAQLAGAHAAARFLEARVETALEADLYAPLRLVDLLDHALRRVEVERDRLLAEHGKTSVERAANELGVRARRGDDDDRVRTVERGVDRRGMLGAELLRMGRVGVDLYPEQIGVPLAEVRTFAKSLGGSATNVAVAAARLGRRTAVITKVGRDGFGDYVRTALAGFGVDARWVGTDPYLRTPIVFCEIYPPDRFPLLFYREPKAPDMNLTRDQL